MRAGLVRMFTADPGLRVAGEARDGVEALRLAREAEPDVLLLDVDMPGLSGVDVARRLHAEQSPVRVLAFTAHTNRAFVQGLLSAGAAGYLTKDKDPALIIDAIKAVARGEGRWFVVPARTAVEAESLSTREREVLIRLASGRSNAEIALDLHLAESTVRNHLTSVYATIGVQSSREAVAWAWRNGVISEGEAYGDR